MDGGMLWFDNDPGTPLPSKVARAADFFRRKYGLVPDLCMVHPSMLPGLSSVLTERLGEKDPETVAHEQDGASVIPTPRRSRAQDPASKHRSGAGGEPSPGLLTSKGQRSEVDTLTCKVAIRPNRLIRPDHLWIGRENEN